MWYKMLALITEVGECGLGEDSSMVSFGTLKLLWDSFLTLKGVHKFLDYFQSVFSGLVNSKILLQL